MEQEPSRRLEARDLEIQHKGKDLCAKLILTSCFGRAEETLARACGVPGARYAPPHTKSDSEMETVAAPPIKHPRLNRRASSAFCWLGLYRAETTIAPTPLIVNSVP